jgi:hypothetical protein
MTLPAGDGSVPAFEDKGCLPVIKRNFFPASCPVAVFTPGGWVIFRINKIQVNILVTVHAFYTNISEIPFFLFFVALQAGSGQVGSFQLEAGLVMFVNGEGGLGKTVYTVAFGTIG